MTDQSRFAPVGIRPEIAAKARLKKVRAGKFPWVSAILLGVLGFCCLFAELFMTKDPAYLDLAHCNVPPCGEFLFGTDSLGRDIFSGILYGGRISIAVGFLSTALSTLLAVVFGSLSGLAPDWLDALMMRFTELFLSVPNLLIVLFLQAILGEANVWSLSAVIGVTSWPTIAKVVRTEVRRLRTSDYILAAKSMGAGFFYILRRHLAPNYIASILFMVVMNVRSAIATESTLSFLGMGLPPEVISWGSMLSLSEKALMSGSWWVILIPGAFLVLLLMCLTNFGNYLRKNANRKESNL